MTDRLSPHFSYGELIRSQLAVRLRIDNRVTDADVIDRARLLAHQVLEPIRARFGPFSPTSWYRCEKLERALCEAQWVDSGLYWPEYFARKQHPKGCAVDIVLPTVSADYLFGWIQEGLNFDQLILEGQAEQAWVHVSYVAEGNRGEVLQIANP